MSSSVLPGQSNDTLDARAAELFAAHRLQIWRQTDRIFAGLMLWQWAGAVAGAYWISPRTWAGSEYETHPHVWIALIVGCSLASLPVLLAVLAPGRLLTQYVVAVAQMLFSVLL